MTIAFGAARRVAFGAALGIAVAVVMPGCGTTPKQPPPAEIQIVHQDASFAIIDTQPMAQVPLIAPPQGGWIVLLGVRAKNVDALNTTLTTALVDPCDGQVLQLDSRLTRLDMGADGWAVSSLTSFGNLPVCPQLTSTRDLDNVPYTVTVSVEDDNGQSATSSLTIVPTCPTDASRCPCECDRDYVVGNACPTVAVPHPTCGAK
jgi:hypothetical protein